LFLRTQHFGTLLAIFEPNQGKFGKKLKFIEGHLKVHSESLALRSQANEILSSNIANAGTPNFKAKDLDFTEMLNSKWDLVK